MKFSLYINTIVVLLLFTNCKRIDKTNNVNNSTRLDTNKTSQKLDLDFENKKADLKDSLVISLKPKIFTIHTIGKAKLIINNKLAGRLIFGEPYFVEFYNKGTWERLKVFEGLTHYDIAYVASSGDSVELEINLQPQPFDYKPGEYRILKEFKSQLTGKTIIATTEFLIE